MAQQVVGRVVGSKIYSGNATNVNEIANQLASQNIIPLVYDIYIARSCELYQYQMVENTAKWVFIMSIKGEAGKFQISKVYKSVAEMNTAYVTDGLPQGALVVINTGNVQDADNAKLYVKGGKSYELLTDMSGSQGIQGPQGIQGAKGDKGASGTTFTPSVSASGDLSWVNNGGLANPTIVNVKGPKGDKGDKGDNGTNGADGKTPQLTINAQGELVATYQ